MDAALIVASLMFVARLLRCKCGRGPWGAVQRNSALPRYQRRFTSRTLLLIISIGVPCSARPATSDSRVLPSSLRVGESAAAHADSAGQRRQRHAHGGDALGGRKHSKGAKRPAPPNVGDDAIGSVPGRRVNRNSGVGVAIGETGCTHVHAPINLKMPGRAGAARSVAREGSTVMPDACQNRSESIVCASLGSRRARPGYTGLTRACTRHVAERKPLQLPRPFADIGG